MENRPQHVVLSRPRSPWHRARTRVRDVARGLVGQTLLRLIAAGAPDPRRGYRFSKGTAADRYRCGRGTAMVLRCAASSEVGASRVPHGCSTCSRWSPSSSQTSSDCAPRRGCASPRPRDACAADSPSSTPARKHILSRCTTQARQHRRARRAVWGRTLDRVPSDRARYSTARSGEQDHDSMAQGGARSPRLGRC
jgi:hypothetical protein